MSLLSPLRALPALICSGLLATLASADNITISLERSRNACRVVHLPPWAGLPKSGDMLDVRPNEFQWPDRVAYIKPHLVLRITGDVILVGLAAPLANADMFPKKADPAFHPDRFALDLERGTLRLATDEEWRTSAALRPPDFLTRRLGDEQQ